MSKNKDSDNTELINIKKENAEIKKQMEEMKNMLQKALKIHPKTLQKINKQLNATNMVNGNINTYNIVQLGNENLNDILSQKQKLKILNRQAMSLANESLLLVLKIKHL